MARDRALAIKALLRDVADRQVEAFKAVLEPPESGDAIWPQVINHIVGNSAMVIDMALDAGDIKPNEPNRGADLKTARAIIIDVCETPDQVKRVTAAMAVIEKRADPNYDMTATLFDSYCQEAGIEPNTPECSIAYRAWSAARDYFHAHADGSTSDGYHTFNELYAHRITLYITLCKIVYEFMSDEVWRSKLHSDGTAIDGWFVLGVGKKPHEQITYHLPLSRWDETDGIVELERAPEFDGHTSADVLARLRTLGALAAL